MSDWLDRIIFGGVLLGICISPWLFGSVEQYAVDALGLLLMLLLALATAKALVDGEARIGLSPVGLCLLLFLAVCVIQIVPLPWSVSSPVIPGAGVSPPLFAENRRVISLDPEATLRAVIKLAILTGYFFLAIHSFRTPRRVQVAVHTLVLLGVAVAGAGILHQLIPNDKILWIRTSDFAAGSFGPFVNRNHFAGFLVLLLPLPLAMVFSRGVSRDRWVLYGFCGITMGCAILYSLSKGGLMALCAEAVLLPILAERERRRLRQLKDWESGSPTPERPWLPTAASILLLVTVVGLGMFWIGGEPLVSRWAGTRAELLESRVLPQSRPATWGIALEIISHYPVFGVGLGAFPRAYPMFDDSPGVYYVGEAHNDYLQVLADTGIIGGFVGALFLYFLASRARRALLSPRREERAPTLGAVVGVCGILVHSLVDFNLQITSNGLLFLALVAIIVSTELRTRSVSEGKGPIRGIMIARRRRRSLSPESPAPADDARSQAPDWGSR